MLEIIKSPQTVSLSSLLTNHETSRIDGDALGAIISFVNPDKSISQLKHVVSQAVYHKLQLIKKIIKFAKCHKVYLMMINCASFVRSLT